LSTLIYLGLIRISLRFYDNEKPRLSELFSQYRLVVKFLIASIFYGLIFLIIFIIVGGVYFIINSTLRALDFEPIVNTLFSLIMFFLAIIIGAFFFIKFMFFPYVLVDQNAGIIESLRRSFIITNGITNIIDLIVFLLLLVIINLIGALALLVGLLLTIPMTQLALAFVYRKLLIQTETTEPKIETPINA